MPPAHVQAQRAPCRRSCLRTWSASAMGRPRPHDDRRASTMVIVCRAFCRLGSGRAACSFAMGNTGNGPPKLQNNGGTIRPGPTARRSGRHATVRAHAFTTMLPVPSPAMSRCRRSPRPTAPALAFYAGPAHVKGAPPRGPSGQTLARRGHGAAKRPRSGVGTPPCMVFVLHDLAEYVHRSFDLVAPSGGDDGERLRCENTGGSRRK